MDHPKHVYETTFIVNATLDDAQIDGVINRVTDLIQKQGGEVRELVKWGRKRFAYPIAKKNNGFYVVCEFAATGQLIGKLERHYFLDENILRYLTVHLSPKVLKVRVPASELLGQPSSETSPAPVPGPTSSATSGSSIATSESSNAGEERDHKVN